VYGGLNLYGIEAEAFDDEARDAARVYASYAAVAVQNMNLHETTRDLAANLDAAMRSRALIEQAKEILMREHHCDAGVAFEILRSASQRYNRKLRDIAQGFVDGEGRGPKG
jgi:AmiR/NasT family two-component response regulator